MPRKVMYELVSFIDNFLCIRLWIFLDVKNIFVLFCLYILQPFQIHRENPSLLKILGKTKHKFLDEQKFSRSRTLDIHSFKIQLSQKTRF